jgi:hypothetical protein
MLSTITTTNHGVPIGVEMSITITVQDKSKWRRFWHWVTFRPAPTRQEIRRVRSVNSTTLEIIS